MSPTELINQYGPTAGTVAAIFLFLKYITSLNKSQNHRDDVFAKALDDMTKSNNRIALYTKKGNDEAAQRNGHLAELTIQSKNDTIKAVNAIKTQHVSTQVVDKQTVKEK